MCWQKEFSSERLHIEQPCFKCIRVTLCTERGSFIATIWKMSSILTHAKMSHRFVVRKAFYIALLCMSVGNWLLIADSTGHAFDFSNI